MKKVSLLLPAAAVLASVLSASPATSATKHNKHSSTEKLLFSASSHEVEVSAGSGKMIQFRSAVTDLYMADPKIADVKPAGSNTAFIMGIGAGKTTLVATDTRGRPIEQFRIEVTPSVAELGSVQAEIRQTLKRSVVEVVPSPAGATIKGNVETAEDAEKAVSILRRALPTTASIDNQLHVQDAVQVTLRVRVVEMSRTLTRDLGFNWENLGGDLGAFAKIGLSGAAGLANAASGTSGTAELAMALKNTNVTAVIDAMAEDQLVRLLAEPNLTAISGQPASFLVGGEFPIPITQQLGQTSVQFKPYGISLDFVPTVLSSGQISLKVRPEVSALTTQGAVSFNQNGSSLTIPAISVRRAETTVELASGQSFAIAGLLQDDVTQNDQGTPFLGDIPYLGALFRSDSFKRHQTELVILVTPYIVRPVSQPAVLQTPDAHYRPPGDLDRILRLRQNAVRSRSIAPIPGDAGFIVE